MRKQLLRLSLACVVAAALSGLAAAHEHDDRTPHGAVEYGFRNGYLDGFQHGAEDRGAQAGYDFQSRDYQSATIGYEPYMGSEELYRNNYRQGYVAGYDDGYYGRGSRFQGQPADPRYQGEAYGYDAGPGYGHRSVAFQVGYRDGLIEGGKDRRKNKDFRPEKHDQYEDASHGYSHEYGSKQEYKREYREGFLAGYQHGYGDTQGGWGR